MAPRFERQPQELNKNREGPIREIRAIVDVDVNGNANIIKACLCSEGCERPLVSVEENGFEALEQAFWVLQRSTHRKLQLVRFTNVEIILG